MLKQENFLTANRDLISKSTSDGLMLMGPEGDSVYIIKGAGRILWDRADGKTTIKQIIDDLAGAFDIKRNRAEKDAIKFLEEAVEANPPLFRISKKAV